MLPIEEKLKSKLEKRALQGNLRRLTQAQATADFFSNDYLGLAQNPDLQKQIELEYAAIHQKKTGATGSRLLSGNSDYAVALEKKLALLFNAEKTLLFNAGFVANSAVIATIPQRGDIILYDELAHACMKEGCRLSFAENFSFKHNDLTDLERKIKKAKANQSGAIFIVVESVYSMDGDTSPLAAIVAIAQKYQAYIILDEAHTTGWKGENGNGLACELGIEKDILLRIYTFGKAIGTHGAVVAGSAVLIDYLINFARGFIYTTALPLHTLVSINQSFDYLQSRKELSDNLVEKINFFKEKAKTYQLTDKIIESNSPIQAIKISGNEQCKAVASRLIQKGFEVRAILSPTVKENDERLRICLHTYNSFEEIAQLLEEVKSIL
jgi:8-amino-7-oxononanoate synthase